MTTPTDPTPRTAATARDALEAICAAHYNDPDGGMGYTSAGYGTFETACVVCGTSDEYAVEWPCWTWTTANAGLIALAAAEAPGRVAALEALADQWEREAEGSGWMEQQPWRIRRQHASALRAALAAPAPTPSEPVERPMTDHRTAATARDALESITRRVRRIPAHRGWYIDHSMDLMHDEGEPCVICDALAAAEAPGRVAALEAALRAIAVREPAPAIPGCTCDPDSATDDDGNLVMCDLHEPMLRHLRWETLASLVIDYQAFMRHALAVADAALAAPAPTPSEPVARAEAMVPAWMLARTYSLLPVDRVALVDDEVNEAIARYLDSTLAATAPAPSDPVECVGCAEHGIHHPSGTPITHRSSAPAPTPSEPVERVRAEYEAWLDEAIAKAKRWRDAGTLTESEYAAAMAVLFVTDAKPTDEEMERIRAMCIERGWTAAPAPTPSEPVARCVGEHDWETRHPGDLAVCRRCWTVESDATPATRDE